MFCDSRTDKMGLANCEFTNFCSKSFTASLADLLENDFMYMK